MIPFPFLRFTMDSQMLLLTGLKKMPDMRIYNLRYRFLLSKVDFMISVDVKSYLEPV